MTFKTILAATAAIALAPLAAQAQDVGVTVMGNDEAAVGTVASNDGTTVVVDTGTYQVPLPANALAEREGAWTVNISKTQLEEMMAAQLAEQQAALEAALVVGAPVNTADAVSLGMIDKIEGANIIIKNEDGSLVTLPADMLALDADGTVMARANMADIEAALEAAQGGGSPPDMKRNKAGGSDPAGLLHCGCQAPQLQRPAG